MISVRGCGLFICELLLANPHCNPKWAALQSTVSSLSNLELGQWLYTLFKPDADLNVNLSLHALHDIQYQTLLSCVDQREVYGQLYEEMSSNRYGKFPPAKLGLLEALAKIDRERLAELRKKLVYRGDDNIQDMKMFYLYLMSEQQILEQSGFALEAVRRFVGNLFQPYYSRFRDILFPLLTSVLLIAQAQAQSPCSLFPCVLDPAAPQPTLCSLVR